MCIRDRLRGHFAEFLNHSYPDRLSILYLTTCVGFGYGPYIHIARGFSRQHRITNFPKHGYASRLTLKSAPDLPRTRATRLHHDIHHVARLPSCVTPSLGYYQFRSPASHTPTTQKRRKQHALRWVSIPDSPWARTHGYGNINPLSIDYACRPRLRSRLTLGGLTWPRNP